jgi:uncharacterized protein YndB with AHSA1/START domain
MPSRVLVAIRVAATPERAFRVFTEEIGAWWRPNGLFPLSGNPAGTLAFEPGPAGRRVERRSDGDYEVGRVLRWAPPEELAFGWRPASFAANQTTEVHVRFEPVGDETRVTVEHRAWDTIHHEHAARHGFPLSDFLQREAEWWQQLLARYKVRCSPAADA